MTEHRAEMVTTGLSTPHLEALATARELLESPGLIARVSSTLATPIDAGMDMLPEAARRRILTVAEASLRTALKTALWSLNGDRISTPSNRAHKAGSAISGALGGAFGLPALAIELPVSTSIMLRSIAEIARAEGEDLSDSAAQMACLEVFALGGASAEDDLADTGYFGVRAALARAVSEAAKYAASTAGVRHSAPPMVRLISQIAARFSIPVSEKAAAQSVPLIGAAGGALINVLFMDHFQSAARGHFIVRRLERVYGQPAVRLAYGELEGFEGSRPGW